MALSAKSTRILFLAASQELRDLYGETLLRLGTRVDWLFDFDRLVSVPDNQDPTIVIVDIDALKPPLTGPLQELRANFLGSELIALSGIDSAQLALQCIRAGFTEFLLKPTSPEELFWIVQKSLQRHQILSKHQDSSDIVRAVTQISACGSPNLIQLTALEQLRKILKTDGAAWLKWEGIRSGKRLQVVNYLPRNLSPEVVLKKLPKLENLKANGDPLVVKDKKGDFRNLVISFQHYPGILFFWGIRHRLAASLLNDIATLIEHIEISLVNLQKFEEVKQQTFVDDLTGLYNSRYLKFALNNAISKCTAPHQNFSVLFIDVDHFKSINDKHNHLIGSQFLVVIGKSVKNAVRSHDLVFRYGGDEFVVILNETSAEGAREIAERIRKNIERRVFVINGHRLQTTVSIGIATYPVHATDRDTLLRLADEAMYTAKKVSRNAVHLAYGVEKPAKRLDT